MNRRNAAFMLAAGWWCAGCGGAGTPAARPKARPAGHSGPEALMRGVHVYQLVEGRLEVEIWAGEAWHSRAADWVGGRQVRVHYFPEGRKQATLHATTARYDIQERLLEAWGAVRVESDGAVLETTQLTYDARRDRIESKEFVRITRGDNVLTGLGLEADPDLGNLQVAEPHVNARNPREIRPLMEGLGIDAPPRR